MAGGSNEVAVVGGGPAGLFAAQRLAESGHRVTVYDRMPSVGRKFLLAGRGGLNLTHSEPLEQFLLRYQSNVGSSPDFIRAAVRNFDSTALRMWADELGAATFTGTSGRVFPEALRATPLLRAWLRKLSDLGVQFEGGWEFAGFTSPSDFSGSLANGEEAPALGKQAQQLTRVILERRTPGSASVAADESQHSERIELATPVLLALGGASWPRLGADGSWVPLFREAGIAIHDLRASNCGLLVSWSDHVTRFRGLPLKNVSLSINGVTRRGELLIDPKGIEGSAAYAIGPVVAAAAAAGNHLLQLDLRADVSIEHLTDRLSRGTSKMSTSTWLTKYGGLSNAAIAVLREIHGSRLTREPSDMAAAIKNVPLQLHGTFPIARAISTAGGVALDAINQQFMLRSHPGVFVAGEMLDWDAPTGGYLLQACFATGSAAAIGIANYCADR
jgi:uncharacterized flavoprotein (TIGR03862 family)